MRSPFVGMTLKNALIVNISVSLAVACLILYLRSIVYGDFPQVISIWVMFFYVIYSVIVSILLFLLMWIRGPLIEGPKERATERIVRLLRLGGYHVSELKGVMNVRLGGYCAVRLRIEECPDGTRILYTPYATPNGLALGVLAVIFAYTAVIPWVVMMVFLLRARRFASDLPRTLSGMAESSCSEGAASSYSIREMLISGLSEARRIAVEAHEAKRSDFHDSILLSLASSLVAAVLVMLVWLYYLTDVATDNHYLPVGTSMVSAAIVFTMGYVIARIRMVPKIDELKSWIASLDHYLSVERLETSLGDDVDSTYDVLDRVGSELPEWLRIRKRAGAFRRPITWSAVAFLSYLSFSIGIAAVSVAMQGRLLAVAIAAVAVCASTVAAVYLAIRARRSEREEKDRFCSEWKMRSRLLRTRMDELWQEL